MIQRLIKKKKIKPHDPSFGHLTLQIILWPLVLGTTFANIASNQYFGGMEAMVDTKKAGEILVTKQMLEKTRDELKSDITAVRHDLKALDHKVDSKINEVLSLIKMQNSKIDLQNSKIDAQNAKIDAQNSKIDKQSERFETSDSKFEKMGARIDRTLALMEDQNARNRYVLDGYQSLHDNIESNKASTDERIDRLESVLIRSNKL